MKIFPGTKKAFRGITLEAIPLCKIDIPRESELMPHRLNMLKTGFDSLSKILHDPFWCGDPITLTKQIGALYKVIDGRHRVFLANQSDSFQCIWARIQ